MTKTMKKINDMQNKFDIEMNKIILLDFYASWRWLDENYSWVIPNLRIDTFYINPNTHSVDSDSEKNTKLVIQLAVSRYEPSALEYAEQNILGAYPDWVVEADTFEQAVIALADHIRKTIVLFTNNS